ncbi:hypothetical protein DPMN_134797 [Dreissena polymorpha]|uniref:Uncharacterized protein n=1 Tax=Dreissena polymorpha TaxID=45954 RepID=A0A9D4G2P7_DREPO|nr:hypothetical protein DPMN_134797 [Dreissena polymorpha]
MDGKANYRADKSHMLACGAIWRLKLRYFRQWLESKEEEIPELEHEVRELEVAIEMKSRLNQDDIREAKDNLLEAVKEKKIGELLDKVDKDKSEDKNFFLSGIPTYIWLTSL